MRAKILRFSILISAACLLVLHKPSFTPESSRRSEFEAIKPGKSGSLAVHSVAAFRSHRDTPSVRVVRQDTSVPEWQKRLGEIDIEWDSDLMGEISATVSDDQIPDALDTLAIEQTNASLLLGQCLLRRWAATSPADAAQWIANLPDNEFSHMALREVMPPWADKDLAGAVRWVQQLPEGKNKRTAQLSLGTEAATRKETGTAITLLAELPPSVERNDLLTYSVRQWATTDWDSAFTWAKQTTDAGLREEMLGNLALDVGVQDPFRAAGFVATLPAGASRDRAVVIIVRFWSPSAPTAAAAWVEQFPESRLRCAAMESLGEVWARSDVVKAREWVNQLPAGDSREAALIGCVLANQTGSQD